MGAGDLAVTGMGAVSALGPDLESLWTGLCAGHSGLAPRADLGPDDEPRCPVGTVALDVDAPRALGLAVRAASEAMDDAGWSGDLRAAPGTALVVATTKGGIDVLQADLRGESGLGLEASWLYALAPRLAAALGVGGPVRTVSVACASGLAAVGEALALVQAGRAARALVVGADAVTDFVYRGFSSLRALDPEGARPFDAARSGLSLGEGAVAITLEPAGDGRTGRALVLGYGASNDANHITGPARDGRGLRLAMQDALHDLAPEAIGFAVAHGTGTPYNDAMEGRAYAEVLPDVPVTGIKGAVGHQMGAAGLANLVVAVRALEAGVCPPTPRLEEVDPGLGLDVVQEGLRTFDRKAAMVSASGFAGVNAAVVLGRRRAPRAASRIEPAQAGPRALVTGMAALDPDRGALVARVGAKVARRLDDLCLFGLAAAQAALEDAGLALSSLAEGPHGLVLGSGLGCLESDFGFYSQALAPDGPSSNPRIFAYTLPNIVLGELAIRGGLTGENLALTAGAVSGLAALEAAVARIEAGRWARAVVLAVEAPGPGAAYVLGAAPTGRASALVLEADAVAGPRGRARVWLEPPPASAAPVRGGGWDRALRLIREGRAESLHVADESGYEAHVGIGAP